MNDRIRQLLTSNRKLHDEPAAGLHEQQLAGMRADPASGNNSSKRKQVFGNDR